MNVTEHKHEVNIGINGIQTRQLKVAATLVVTHGENNQIWNVTIYTVVQQIRTPVHIL